jgi:hypothetical protein
MLVKPNFMKMFAVIEFLCGQAEGRAEWILVGASQGYESASKAGIRYMVSVVGNRDGIADFVTRIQGCTND